jgi:3-hydroxyisobutyrate dehydrogenase-like beta-hydroxyacid dehydrogenase
MKQQTGNVRLGFIGFGEAVNSIAAGLKESGYRGISAYYHRIQDEQSLRTQQVIGNAATHGVALVSSLEELAAEAELIINLTNGQAALAGARRIAPVLGPQHLYADLNSCEPSTKKQIASLFAERNIRFSDGVIMAPVPLYQHQVPILACGEGGREFAAQCSRIGMQIEFMEGPAGSAAAIKMLRSIFMKGMAAVCLETYLAARLHGDAVYETVIQGLDDTFAAVPFPTLFRRFILGTMEHAGRREYEVEDAMRMLREEGVEPIIAKSTGKLLHAIAALELSDKPQDLQDTQLITDLLQAYKQVAKEEGKEVNRNEPTS